MKIDHIYIINLHTSLKLIKEKLSNIPVLPIPYTIFPAINGWNPNINFEFPFKAADWWKIDTPNTWHNRNVTKGEVGCTLSHHTVIREALSKNYDNVLILEEDFVPLGTFPSQQDFQQIPKDYSLISLGYRSIDTPKQINKNVIKLKYHYEAHAYIISKKGIIEIINSPIINNIIPFDEFIPAINGTTPRKDANKLFHNPNFKQYAFKDEYFGQFSNSETSTTLNNPNI